MEVSTIPRKFKHLYNAAEKSFRLIGKPQDIIDKNVNIKVLEVNGKCPINIVKGDKFRFNIDDKQELCPASFNLLLPFILSKLANQNENMVLQCPSDACRIRYKIEN